MYIKSMLRLLYIKQTLWPFQNICKRSVLSTTFNANYHVQKNVRIKNQFYKKSRSLAVSVAGRAVRVGRVNTSSAVAARRTPDLHGAARRGVTINHSVLAHFYVAWFAIRVLPKIIYHQGASGCFRILIGTAQWVSVEGFSSGSHLLEDKKICHFLRPYVQFY